ncbi:MAG TPA: ABC transporter permease [Acidimicrobiales bacterium]|nr:ABC transporter permease [Acidimicrobiales bacterium]
MGAVILCALPIVGLAWRAPWSSLFTQLGRPGVRTALWLSLVCSVAATALSIALGLPLAWILARFEFPGRRVLRALAVLPMVLPPVVGGLALLTVFGRRGMVGQLLFDWFGVTIPYTIAAAILAEAFVAMPFFVVTAEAGLRSVDRRFEEAARTLGASRRRTFLRVTVPLVRPSLIAGAVLCWARALGEFGATITFAGNSPHTDTMPLQIFLTFQQDPGGALVLSLVLIAVSLVVLIALRERWLGSVR